MQNISEPVIQQAKDGNMAAWEEIVSVLERPIYNLMLRMTGRVEDAQDLTQETFLKMFRSIGSFQGDSALTTWAYRIASNTCYDFLRKKKGRTLSLEEELDEGGCLMDVMQGNQPDPYEQLERQERLQALSEGLLRLSPQHRKILVLRDVMGLSYGEISDVLSLEEGTVKSRLSRSRRRLRKILSQPGNVFAHSASKKSDGR